MGVLRRSFGNRSGTQSVLDFSFEEHVLMSFHRSRFARILTGAVVVAAMLGVATSASAVERSLAGIALGSKASAILKKYGNPSRITVGTVSAAVNVPNQPTVQPAPGANPYLPPMGVGTYPGAADSYNPFGTGPYAPPPAGGLPGLPGMAPPMPGIPGGEPQQPGQPQQQVVTQQEVTWTYEFTKGVAAGDTAEFIISEGGIVTQITVGGAAHWLLSKTSLGIKLGDDYKSVLFKYGYPEGHAYAGKFLRASYVDRQRVMFTFLDRKVVGITIALPE